MSESKESRFYRVAEARVNKILSMLRLLGNCSNTMVYAFRPDQVDQIFSTLQNALDNAKERFLNSSKKKGKSNFHLSDETEADTLESKTAIHITWDEISAFATRILSEAQDREVIAEAAADDEAYWGLNFSNTRITLNEERRLLDMFDADDEDRRLTENFYLVNPSVKASNCLSMEFAFKVIRRIIPLQEIVTSFIDEESGLWVIGDAAEKSFRGDILMKQNVCFGIQIDELPAADFIMQYLMENDACSECLKDLRNEQIVKFGKPLFWHYPFAHNHYPGGYIFAVKEGAYWVPYQEMDMEFGAVFGLHDDHILDPTEALEIISTLRSYTDELCSFLCEISKLTEPKS